MSFLKYTITFIAGIYIGQEYGNTLPSVKKYTRNVYESFTHTDFYKKIKNDFNKKN